MENGQLRTLIHCLRRLAGPDQAGALADGQLLERFVTHRDEAAFEVLVWRHGPMVLNVCRRLLQHTQDAEDAFQATFLAFARKAASIRKGETIAGWLYRVAYRVALRARARSARRAQVEQQAIPAPAAEPVDELVWRDLRPVLDEAINRLPEKYRLPIVLCYLQGQTHREAAQRLGCPLGTVVSRLARARERLRTDLGRRGLALTAGGLTSILAETSGAAALPGPLVRCTVHAGLLYAAGGGTTAGVIAAPVAALTEGVLRSMLLTKWLVVSTVVLLGCGIGTSVVGLRGPSLAAQPPQHPTSDAVGKPSTNPPVHAEEARTGRFRVGVGVNSDAGLTGSILLNERNFDLFRPPARLNDVFSGQAFRGGGQELRVEREPGTQLQWKWEKAKPFYQEITTETDQQLKVMGQNVTQRQRQTFYLRWTSQGRNPDGQWVVTQRVEGVKIDINVGGTRLQFDSTTGKGDAASPLADYYKALVGTEFRLTLLGDARGLKIDGFDQFLRKLSSQHVNLRAQSVSDYSQMLAVWLLAVPDRPVQIGDTWSRKSKFSLTSLQGFDATYQYTYAGKEGALDKITVRTQLQYQVHNPGQLEGFPSAIKKVDLKTSEGTGVILFDRATGRIVRSELTLDLEGPMAMILDGKETQVILKQRQKTTVRTADVNGFKIGGDFMFLNSLEYQMPRRADDPKEENRRLREENERLRRRLQEIERALKNPSAKKPEDLSQVFNFWAGFFH